VDRLQSYRAFFADLTIANARVPRSKTRLRDAFAATPRERFLGPGPWRCFTPVGYVGTQIDDPALIYQDVTVAISIDPPINNGQPTLHAMCLAALDPNEGETALHVGAGTGYYTAILARLVGPSGSVQAYEIDPGLAQRAADNLADLSNATVHTRSGTAGALPPCDCLYVNAGVTDPPDVWLDALRPGGRLVFPLTPDEGYGAMLLVTRNSGDQYTAKFLTHALFIPCVGARNEETSKSLARAFQRGTMGTVQTLRRHTPPDDSSWCAGQGWWLSTKPAD
jgi:protein-L-isoaspartate(D-aspartate) O-methyltransferase